MKADSMVGVKADQLAASMEKKKVVMTVVTMADPLVEK